MSAAPHVPLPLRLLALGNKALHRATGGRFGSAEPARAVPSGRALEIITAVHRRVYRWTGGVVGSNLLGIATLLLTTTGRKTGLQRTVPLPYFPHPEGVLVVASFAGGPKDPAWYTNLLANPEVEVQIKGRRFHATARAAGPDERPALWSRIVAASSNYADYQRITTREIPVVILRERPR